MALLAFAPALLADVTINGTTSFAALDGSAEDADHSANGIFTVGGDLIVNGTINCNDDGPGAVSACSMSFNVGHDLVVNAGGGMFAENRTGGGTGGAITLTVAHDLVLHGASPSLAGAIISTDSQSSAGASGGSISAAVGGALTVEPGATIDAGSANAAGGNVSLVAGSHVEVGGNVLSGPSRSILSTRLTDAALGGGTANQSGGAITIRSRSSSEPAVVIGSNANVIAQGEASGSGPVIVEGCGVVVKGLVAALARKSAASRLAIRSGQWIQIDGRDLGVAGASLGRNGRLRADAITGTAMNHTIDLFAATDITILGPDPARSSLFSVTGLPGLHDSKSDGATIRVIAAGGGVTASGNVIDDGRDASGDDGGNVDIAAKQDVNLDHAVIASIGDSGTNNNARGGGTISVRSYSGNVSWTSGAGDVRPTGSGSGLAVSAQGSISITACGTINLGGSSFPTNGAAVGSWPNQAAAACSLLTPALPAGEPALPVCNTPPVAGNGSATTLEDSPATITMTATDADSDPLTFTIVTVPVHGSLGAIFGATATSAQVTYAPDADYNGADSFTFQADDGKGGVSTGTVTITITPVNDPPYFALGANPVTSLEDAGVQTVAGYASGISAGPTADESSQSVTFTVNNDNNALFSVQPAISSSGVLTYTAAADANGSANVTVVAHDSGGTANGGNDTSAAQHFNIFVTAVNDMPSFTKGADQTADEDAGAQSVANWATAVSPGPADESGQTVTFAVTNSNDALFSAQPAVASNGTLIWTAAPNANGTATVTVAAHDDGGTANGGVDTSAAQTFTITVNAVNDAPSFTSGGDVAALEDSGPFSAAWATSVSAGPADESGQTLTFTASNDNNALFSVQPSVAPNGTLTFTLAADANGTATLTVTAHDDGGTANGGIDTSAPQMFAIHVTAVNDAPSFLRGPDQSLFSNAGPQSIPNWATSISAGPSNEASQLVSFIVTNDANSVFTAQPAVTPSGTLTFTPAVAAPTTTVHVSVAAQDNGGTANGGVDTSAAQTFAINVTHANQPPAANPDAFEAVGNTELAVGTPGTQAATLAATGSVLANDSDVDGDPLTATLGATSAGASVSMNADGSFTYLPPAGFSGDDTFTYVLSDGQGHNVNGTVTIHVNKRVLYVKNNGGGSTGRVDSPFATLAAAQAASAANDTVYVFTGDGTTLGQNAGFVIDHDGERLIGEGVALIAAGTYNGASNPQLRAAGTAPSIANAGGVAVTVARTGTLATAEISGIRITGAGSHGVQITDATNVTMNNDRIDASHNSGIRGSAVNGFSFTAGSIQSSGSASGDANMSFDNLTGSATIADSTFSGAFNDNVRIANSAGTLNRLTLSNDHFNGNSTTTGNTAVNLTANNGTTLNVTVTGSHFTSTRAQHFQLSMNGTASSDVVFTGNTVSNAQAALSGGGGILIATGGGPTAVPTLTYDVSNNSIRDAVGAAISVTKGSGTGSATGTIRGNTIGVTGVTDSGSAQGDAVAVTHVGGGSTSTTIVNNAIAQYNNNGISLQIGDHSSGGNGSMVAVVRSNIVSNPGSFALNGVLLNAGTSSGDAHSVCLTLGGTGPAANALAGAGSSANGGFDARLRQRMATTLRLAGYAGANNDNAAVQAYVQSQNGGTATVSASNSVPTGGGFVGGTCP